RLLIASECLGDGRWFTEKAVAYTKDRKVFGRPIGQNQGVQFPIARAYAELQAAESQAEWFRRVDGALYQAKKQGRNQVIAAE
ncbi:MAG TPA: acyl-CoA dehydrogenase family protein, partial [Rhodoferax sp.]|nr:acyl-CoA dehydrogenase family protein [Rhodoferax sp.]